MTQKEHDKKFAELNVQLAGAEKRVQEIRDELDKLSKVPVEPERRWKPELGQRYYYITSAGKIFSDLWLGNSDDLLKFVIGNVFQTKEEAEFEVERLKVIAELKEFAEPDNRQWDNVTWQWNIIYNHNDADVCAEQWTYIHADSIYFRSPEKAEEAIKAVGEDRIKKYYLRVKE